MATESAINTPADMIASLREVGDYRETMTYHAAGVIWIIWGLVMASIGLFSLAFMLGAPAAGWADLTAIIVFGAAGAIATNLVWRSHALERDEEHPAWIAWAAGLGTPLAIGAVVWLSNLVFDWGTPSLTMAPLMLLGAGAAFTLAWLQRRHTSATSGFAASGVLFAAFFFARLVPLELTPLLDTAGNAALSLVNLAAFTIVGLLHIRRG